MSNFNNWYNGKVIDRKTSQAVLIDTARMVENLGFEISYEVHTGNNAFEDAITIPAYIVFDENKQVNEIQVSNKGQLIISTKSLMDNDIVPTEGDRITYEGVQFNIVPGSIYYYSRNNKEVDHYQNSYYMQLTVVAKTGYKRMRGFV